MNTLQRIGGAFLAFLLVVGASPSQAQMEDGELPSIDFSVDLMQSAQFLTVDDNNPYSASDSRVANPDPDTDEVAASTLDGRHDGFHQIRAGLNASVQFSERVSGLLMIQAEPNDFGQNGFAPAVDFAVLDLQLTDQLTFRTGTPVTGLINFRGFSDGPVTQGNPLVGNSPADMITAAHGVKLIGGFDSFGFDLTVNRSFAGDFSSEQTGVNIIGKARFTGSDLVKVGAGFATHTGQGVTPNGDNTGSPGVVFANGDRENYNFPGTGANSTETHVNMPSGTIVQGDAKLTAAGADVDLWGGYATESDYAPYGGDTYSALFAGLGAKYSLTDALYGAGRFTYITDQSDGASDTDHTTVSRIQVGLGYTVFEKALFKVEYVRQVEGANTSLSRIGNNWSGVTTELSFNF